MFYGSTLQGEVFMNVRYTLQRCNHDVMTITGCVEDVSYSCCSLYRFVSYTEELIGEFVRTANVTLLDHGMKRSSFTFEKVKTSSLLNKLYKPGCHSN